MAYTKNNKSIKVVFDIETVAVPPSQRVLNDYIESYEDKGKSEDDRRQFLLNAESELTEKNKFTLFGKKMICIAWGEVLDNGDVITSAASGDDPVLLVKEFSEYLDSLGGEYVLIGYNSNSFDLPEVCKWMAVGNCFPNNLPKEWGTIDLMNRVFKNQKLKYVAESFGLDIPDSNGDDVAGMYADGRWEDIIEYAKKDVVITGKLFHYTNKLYRLCR